MNTLLYSFPPVYDEQARVLILGSMPGTASLQQAQYYAHPRNAFWFIMGELAGARPELDYEQRLDCLRRAGIALWDVLAACQRPGSLDANILSHSQQPNDIAALLQACPLILRVMFNGAAAENLFRRHVRPQLQDPGRALDYRENDTLLGYTVKEIMPDGVRMAGKGRSFTLDLHDPGKRTATKAKSRSTRSRRMPESRTMPTRTTRTTRTKHRDTKKDLPFPIPSTRDKRSSKNERSKKSKRSSDSPPLPFPFGDATE